MVKVLMLYNRVCVHKQNRELYYLPVKHYLFNSEDKNKERPWISKVQSLSKNLTWCRRRTSVTEQSLNNNMDYLSPWSLMCSAVCMNHMQSHPKHTLRGSDHSGSSWKQTRWKLNKSQVMCCPSEQVDLMLVKYCFYSSGWKFFPTSFSKQYMSSVPCLLLFEFIHSLFTVQTLESVSRWSVPSGSHMSICCFLIAQSHKLQNMAKIFNTESRLFSSQDCF